MRNNRFSKYDIARIKTRDNTNAGQAKYPYVFSTGNRLKRDTKKARSVKNSPLMPISCHLNNTGLMYILQYFSMI